MGAGRRWNERHPTEKYRAAEDKNPVYRKVRKKRRATVSGGREGKKSQRPSKSKQRRNGMQDSEVDRGTGEEQGREPKIEC